MTSLERTSLYSCALLACAAVGHAQAQRPFINHASPTPMNSFFGAAIEGLGDVDGDGVADYAISGNGITLAGNGAGAVQVFSPGSATPTVPIWTTSGLGGWIPCPGGGGTTGDFFGFDMERIPDIDGDGIDDLAVGAPFTGVPNGPCFTPFFGSVSVLSGATGALLSTRLGRNASDFYGTSIKRVPDMFFSGADDYIVVAGGGYADIIDGATGLLAGSVPLNPGETVVTSAGDVNGDGFFWEVAIGNPSLDSVRIVDVIFATTTTFTGPAGSSYGAALEYVPGAGVLVGAPGQAAGAGAVYYINGGINALLSTGAAAGDALGSSLAYGGNADLDMIQNDLIAGAPGGNYARLMTLGGVLIQDTVGTTAATWGNAVDWVGDIIGNGFDEFTVGDNSAGLIAGNADTLFGGPAGTLNQNFGAGCNPNGGAVPVLTQSAPLVPGATYSFSISATPSFSSGFLYLGLADSVGIVFPPCTVWMNPNFGPFQAAPIFTNFAGNWTSPVFPLPLDANLVGLNIAHQALIFPSTGGSWTLSNATSSQIGW